MNKKEIIQKLADTNLLTDAQLKGLEKQFNKGIASETLLIHNSGLIKEEQDAGFDFGLNGLRVEFKYLGLNSKPSLSEMKKQADESQREFAERIVNKHYLQADCFMSSIKDELDIQLSDCFIITKEAMLEILSRHNTKEGNKIRLLKGIVKQVLGL